MQETVLLSSAYMPPVQWFAKLAGGARVYVEQYDHYRKQTYRNRCVIATQAGTQALVIPVTLPHTKTLMRDVRISEHGNWRHNHWQALASAYDNSPFFEYYADDIRPFYENPCHFLLDFNQRLAETLCGLLGIECRMTLTEEYADPAALGATDCRDSISPKHPGRDNSFVAAEYYQVFAERNGFRPNLSVADLLFNEGPEGILALLRSVRPQAGQAMRQAEQPRRCPASPRPPCGTDTEFQEQGI